MKKAKNILTIFLAVAVMIILPLIVSSCVDIIRGNKNITSIQKTFDSQISMYSETEATVQADKDYTDSGQIELPLK